MGIAKKHMSLNIWLSPDDWRNAFEILKHHRDMETCKTGKETCGQPESFLKWVWEVQLPQLAKRDDRIKQQLQKELEQVILLRDNTQRQIENETKTLCLKKEELNKEIAKLQKVLQPDSKNSKKVQMA